MNRRGFFKALSAVVGGIAIEQAIPLGRVWSFPSKIVIPEVSLSSQQVIALQLEAFAPYIKDLIEKDNRLFGLLYHQTAPPLSYCGIDRHGL